MNINMIHTAHVWICCLDFDPGNRFCDVHGTVVKRSSVWLRLQDQACGSHGCTGSATLESQPIFDILWAISERLMTNPAEHVPACHLDAGYDLMSIHSHAGETGTVRNGYSLLLFPIESWRHPRKLCGTRSKKSRTKYFCTQLITLISITAEYYENHKHGRTQ